MANAAVIRETLAVFRANPALLNMRSFACVTECGTTFCLAGMRAEMDGYHWDEEDAMFASPDGYAVHAFDWAQTRMGLTFDEAYDLFLNTSGVTALDALEWVAEQIIAGNALTDCPQCRGEQTNGLITCARCHGAALVLLSDTEPQSPGQDPLVGASLPVPSGSPPE